VLYFGVFTLVKTKLPHYTLPAFPMLALLLGSAISGTAVRKMAQLAGVVFLGIFFIGFPLAAPLFPAPALAAQSAAVLRPEMEFASVEFVEPSLYWSFRRYVRGFHKEVSLAKAPQWMQKKGPRFYILPTAAVANTFPSPDPTWKIFQHSGINFAKGTRTDLTMIVKPQ
jgi:hypothetical protein